MNEEIRAKTCCFTGHRTISKPEAFRLALKLSRVIEKLIKDKGVIYFGVGGAVGFDMLAEKAVLRLKRKYPFIKLILVLPCKNHTKKWNDRQRAEFNKIKQRADKITYEMENYIPCCTVLRNRRLVHNSKYCIAYCNSITGGTAYTVNYAKENKLDIINLVF